MGLFGGTSDRGEMLALQARVSQLEEQVARLTAAQSRQPAAAVPGAGENAPAAMDDVYAEARALAAAGNKIHAIKVVREQSGMGLRQAKDLVESW